MKIVVVYGPPGVGKLTVGRLLAKKTGFKLIHSHLLAEAILCLFPYGAKEFYPLMEKMRLEFLRRAAKSRRIPGVILTGVYSAKTTIDITDRLLSKIARIKGVRMCFVKLSCAERELYRRIKQPSRREFRKIREKSALAYLLRNYRITAAIGSRKSLDIDNTELPAERCARQIMRHYGL